MKTSNKIFFTTLALIFVGMISLLLFLRANMVPINENQVVGNGNITRVDYPVDNFHFLELGQHFEVHISKGTPAIAMETDENLQGFFRPEKHISIYNEDGNSEQKDGYTMRHMGDRLNFKPTKGMKLFITVPQIETLKAKDFSQIYFDDAFATTHFKLHTKDHARVHLQQDASNLFITGDDFSQIEMTGAIGEVEVQLKGHASLNLKTISAQKVNLSAQGFSKASLAGTTQDFVADLSGNANVQTAELNTKIADIKASDFGIIHLDVVQQLKVRARGNGKIIYTGSATVDAETSDFAKVEQQ